MLSIEEYDTRFPKFNREYFDELSEDEKTIYLRRLEKYVKSFIKYLKNKANLDEIETSIYNSDCYLIPIEENKMDLYQRLCYSELKYIYLRNNIYIERLSKEELSIIDTEEQLSDDFIESTYKKLINDYPDKDLKVNYGPDSLKFYAKSSGLIIGIRVDEDYFPENSNHLDLILKRQANLNNYSLFVESRIRRTMGIIAQSIVYNDYSVVTKYNKKKIEMDIQSLK